MQSPAPNDSSEYTDRERNLLLKCIHLIQGKTRENPTSASSVKDLDAVTSPSDEATTTDMTTSMTSNATTLSADLCSPERATLPGERTPLPLAPVGPSGPREDPELVLYVPDMEEIRISPVVARKGYLNVLDHKTHGWKKRWVVSRFLVCTSLSLFTPL